MVALVCTGLVAVGIGLASGAFSGGANADQRPGRSEPPRRPASSSPTPSGPARSPAAATAAFGLDLLGKLPPGNTVVSPDSIATALAMAGSGAKGATAKQVAETLHLKGPTAFNSIGGLQRDVFAAQAKAAQGHPSAPTLTIANGLFVQQGYSLAPAFVGGLSEHFGAAPEAVDFAGDPPGATAAINSWTSAHTNGVITELFSELSPETRLVLANAVYLKAKWRSAFNSGAWPGPFHRNGKTTKAKFMNQTDEFDYAAGPGYEAVDLPYHGSTLSMLVVLPTGGRSVAGLESQLREEGISPVVNGLSSKVVHLRMPRFHLRTTAELNAPLEALGMKLPFTEGADFSGITTADPLRISQIQHVADITVDEEGTEAAAATGIEVEATSAEIYPESVVFDADHPFLFFVRDDKTGAVLFAGRLTNPQGT